MPKKKARTIGVSGNTNKTSLEGERTHSKKVKSERKKTRTKVDTNSLRRPLKVGKMAKKTKKTAEK